MKKLMVLFLTVACMLSMAGCKNQNTNDISNSLNGQDNANIEEDNQKSLSEIGIAGALNLESSSGVGVELVFESEDMIVFYGDFGLFGYNLNTEEIEFSVDFVKAVGIEGSVQGSKGPAVEVSADGNTVVICEYDAETEMRGKACYIDIPTLTYTYGEYNPMESVFEKENAKGYIYPGVQIGQVKYILGDNEWQLFD